MEPDTTIIAGASSWRGTFTQCGGIPRMMAGSLVVAGEQVGTTTSRQLEKKKNRHPEEPVQHEGRDYRA